MGIVEGFYQGFQRANASKRLDDPCSTMHPPHAWENDASCMNHADDRGVICIMRA